MSDKLIINQNVFFVDLGLPSRTKWASSNVGANVPHQNGIFFDFANIGYLEEELKKPFSECFVPTEEDFEELISYCKWVWTSVNGVDGYKVYGPNERYIFLPVTGYMTESDDCPIYTEIGHYWSSTKKEDYSFSASSLTFCSEQYTLRYEHRELEFCARLVQKQEQR